MYLKGAGIKIVIINRLGFSAVFLLCYRSNRSQSEFVGFGSGPSAGRFANPFTSVTLNAFAAKIFPPHIVAGQ